MSHDRAQPDQADQAEQAEQADQPAHDEASKKARAAEVLRRNIEKSRELLEARKRQRGGQGHQHAEEEDEDASATPRHSEVRAGAHKGRGSNFKVGRRGG